MQWWRQRPLVAGAVALVAAGFGFGYLSAEAGRALTRDGGGPGLFAAFSSPFGKPRSADAPRAGVARPEGFAVWRHRVDTTGAAPRACVEFSRPLDPKAEYGDFVLVSPDPGRSVAATVKDAELCLTGLGFYDRRVTLLKGLPSAQGDALAANADVDFTFGEKPPYVGFAGEGVILPREEADGVALETVNVTRLAVEVWRVPDRNLVRKEIAAPSPTAEGEWPSDWGSDSPDDEGRVVWKGEVPIRAQGAQRATTVFPLGAVLKDLKAGAYVIKARDASGGRGAGGDDYGDPPAQARRWILFTDMAVVSYRGADGLDVTVRSLKSAKPLSGVRVALVARNGEDLAEGRTDRQGRVRFDRPLLEGEGAGAAKMLAAYGPGADFTALDLDRPPVDLSNLGVGGRQTEAAPGEGRRGAEAVDAFVYADRGVYRPGETVRLVALLRDGQAKAVKDRRGFIVVNRPSGVEAFRFRFDGTPKGFAAADAALPRGAPRGRWSVQVLVDGLTAPAGVHAFAVEDFAPQRLAVDLGADAERPVDPAEGRSASVNARFLYGAAAAGLPVQGELRLRPDPTPFKAFADYVFADEQKPFEERFVELGATVTDGEGRAVLNLDVSAAAEAAQPVRALVTASVFEPGGRPVREGTELKVLAKPLYLGVKVDPGETGARAPTVNFDVVAVDRQGRRVAAPEVSWTLVAENWDYDWWQQDGRWRWRRTSRDVVVAKGTTAVGAERAARLARRLDWGDYRIELEHAASGARTVARFASGWGSPAADRDAPDAVRVGVGTKTYKQGDTVEVTIKAPYAGQAQVAVATDRVLELREINVPEGGATVRLRTDPSWGGGAYVLVSVVQPRDPVDTPRPRRALGLVYVPLDPQGRKLEVMLGAPDKVRGREPITVPVEVRGLKLGEQARVTVAAVDQGVLNLTKFESPDPVRWYFGKRALGVDYRDDYGRLLDPNLGAPAALNYGGDGLGEEGLTASPIRVVALWSGVVETGRDGRARVTLPAADFNGELRLMAVAWTDDAVGSGARKLVVREPVVAELSLPRFLAPGDRFSATLEMHNVEGAAGVYQAVVRGLKGLVAEVRRSFTLGRDQRATDRVEIAAPARAGVGGVELAVSGPQFSQTRAWDLETRAGWGAETRVTTELQRPGEAWTPPAALLAGYQPGSATLQVSYSPIRGVDPGPLAASLSAFPYGCSEQVASGAYAWLYVQGEAEQARSRALLSQAVGRLLDRQSADGAFGLWRAGDGAADAFVGAYLTDFLVEARARGAPVPQPALDRALSAMRRISRPEGWASVSYRMEYPLTWYASENASREATKRMRSQASAYALYVLAKAGQGDLARLRWYHDVQFKQERSPLARAQVGAGLALMGDKARSASAFRQAVQTLGYENRDDWYQSPLRDLAAVIALAYEAGHPQIARDLQTRLERAVKGPDQLNTQEKARLLQAAQAMIKASGPVTIEAAGVTALISPAGPRYGVGRLADARLTNRGSGAVWRTVTVRGAPAAAPAARAEGLSLDKRLFTLQGAPVDASTLAQGQRVVVLVSGRSAQARVLPLIVDDALPAGWEIETVLTPEDSDGGAFKFLGPLSWTLAQESRDDRFVAAADVPGNERFAVAYVARAVTPGDFFLPGAEARDLYRPEVFARTGSARTRIAAR